MQFVFFFLSWALVAFGQPAWVPLFAPLAASFGYALLWYSLRGWSRPWQQITFSALWFAAVQAIHLSWMSETEYMGPLILVVYACLTLALGAQFGVLSRFALQCGRVSWLSALGISGLWVLFEWMRLYVCTGFTWNPVGLAETAFQSSLQMAALFGIYGLSFWVIFTNLFAFAALIERTRKALVLWGMIAAFPFIYGSFRLHVAPSPSDNYSVLLVQTALLPDQRAFDPQHPEMWVPELAQWERILHLIHEKEDEHPDLIVLPEASLPFSAFEQVYPHPLVERVWMKVFGEKGEQHFPSMGQKNSSFLSTKHGGVWRVSNAFWLQALANRCNCEVVAGMEDDDRGLHYNAALHFLPGQEEPSRYEKRILVPIGEYVPLQQSKAFAEYIAVRYGIASSYTPGEKATICKGRLPLGISICLEETYSQIVRQLRSSGAELLVNLSNDGWFPRSKLSRQHFDHGIIRAVENGLPAVRSCTTGVTGAVDCFGRVLGCLPEGVPGALLQTIPLQTVPTLYVVCGDALVLSLSGIFLLTFLCWRRRSCLK